jgi:hypothetical protein
MVGEHPQCGLRSLGGVLDHGLGALVPRGAHGGRDPATSSGGPTALVADRVLAPLLLEHGIPAVLVGTEQAAVLDPAIELPDDPLFLPGEVRPRQEFAAGRPDLELQCRWSEPQFVQDDAAPALTDALAPAVGEPDDAGGMSTAACAGDVEQPSADQLPGEQALVQSRVDRDDGRLEGEAAGQIERRPCHVGDPDTADGGGLVVPQAGHVAPEGAGRLARRRRGSDDVHLVEGRAPQGKAEEDGGRLVADHRGTAQVGESRRDQQRMPCDGGRRQLSVQVGAASYTGPGPTADQPRQLLVRPAVGYSGAAEDESFGGVRAMHAVIVRPGGRLQRPHARPVDDGSPCG